MQITDVRVRKIASEGRMKAVVSMTIDNVFVVHDIKVIQGADHLFIAMPSKKVGTKGEFRDIAHPLTSETRNMIKDIILEAYEKELQSEDNNSETYEDAIDDSEDYDDSSDLTL